MSTEEKETSDESREINEFDERCPLITFFYVISFVFFTLCIILGSIGLSYTAERDQYLISDCYILNLKYTLSRDCPGSGTISPECQNKDKVKWTVSYWNSIASLKVNDFIEQQFDSDGKLLAFIWTYGNGTVHSCYYLSTDSTLSWSLPRENYNAIRWSGFAFLLGTILCFIIAFILCRRCQNDNSYYPMKNFKNENSI